MQRMHLSIDGDVGGTESHAELHMRGVHFMVNSDSLRAWMDMLENGEVAFQTSYVLVRGDSADAPDGSRGRTWFQGNGSQL